MVSDIVCRFNQFGYCKFQDHCFRKHVNSICENEKCLRKDCEKRHPRECRYFSRYSYCKFGEYCKFRHGKIRNCGYENEISNLKSEIENLKKVIKAKENERDLLEQEKNKCMEKAVSMENENLKLRETITDMGKDQEALADKRAVESMIYQGFKERMKIKYLYDSDDEESDYESDEEKRERSRELFRKRKEDQRKLQNNCELCDFIGQTTGGLKTHVRKKH